MEKSEQKITAPIFEIDAQEMNALVDDFVRARELDKDQEVKDYYERLKSVEEAIKTSRDNIRTLLAMHKKIPWTELICVRMDMNNPTSLSVREHYKNTWCIFNRIKDPIAYITEDGLMFAKCSNRSEWHMEIERDIEFSADSILDKITKNGLRGNKMGESLYLLGDTTYRDLIETMEYMVRTLPLYVKAFKEYIQKKGM